MTKPLLVLSAFSALCIGAASPHRAGADSDRLVRLTLEQVTEGPGHLTLRAAFANISNGNVMIGVGSPLIDYELTVTDTSGVPLPLSPYGKEIFSKERVRSRMYVQVTLAPGESRTDKWSIAELFNFKTSGKYLVTVRRQFRTEERSHAVSPQRWVASNTLEITFGPA